MTAHSELLINSNTDILETLQRHSAEASLTSLLATSPSIRMRAAASVDKWQMAIFRFVDLRTVGREGFGG